MGDAVAIMESVSRARRYIVGGEAVWLANVCCSVSCAYIRPGWEAAVRCRDVGGGLGLWDCELARQMCSSCVVVARAIGR